MKYYEAHITMLGIPDIVKPLVEHIGWKFSSIDGDINLGDGLKCYATKQFNGNLDQRIVLGNLKIAAAQLRPYVTIIREKVEQVIYDSRSKKVRLECNGGCPECLS